ncbi:MAG: T9SS type A sorting domain-containing protein [Chlorobi bacterium]|nr:T9SS type A sorting domain-containing protein [Chlorobiota bacterium]
MRKTLVHSVAMLVSLGMVAQTQTKIPNASFEEYDSVTVPVPANWEHSSESFKILYEDQFSYGVMPEEPGYSGSYALRIEVPDVVTDTFFGVQIVTLPTKYSPASIEMWNVTFAYKYFPKNQNDTAIIRILGFDDTLGVSAVANILILGNTPSFVGDTAALIVNLTSVGKGREVKHWAFVFSQVNPGCTLVVDDIKIYDASHNIYTTFPLNPDFEDWYYVTVDTFNKWTVDAAFDHELIRHPFGKIISKIKGKVRATSSKVADGRVSLELAPAYRPFISDTPYNALYQRFDIDSLFDFQFAYQYISPTAEDSASILVQLFDSTNNTTYFSLKYLPQTGDVWDTIDVPLTTLCSGCDAKTMLIAFLPQRVYLDTSNNKLINLPVDTAARLYLDVFGTVISALQPSSEVDIQVITMGNTYQLVSSSDIQHLEVINTAGQVMKREKLAQSTRTYKLDLNNLSKGIYFIKVTTMEGTNLLKVQVK